MFKRRGNQHQHRASFRSVLMRSRNKVKHEKDFDWRPRKHNPYSRREGTDRRWKIKLGALVFSLLGILTLFIYHPFFHITKFNIIGRQRINEADLQNSLKGMVDYHKFFILPADSYLLVDTDNIEDLIRARFPIESVIASKIFPQTLNVTIEEKISTIIYDNGRQYSYLGLDGNVVEILRKVGDSEWYGAVKMATTTLANGTIQAVEETTNRYHIPPVNDVIFEMGDYPIVYDKRLKEGSINEVVLEIKTVQGIIEWFNLLDSRTDVPVGYFVLDSELVGDALIKTREGWEIKVNIFKRIAQQFDNLQYILKEKGGVERKNLNYIDLRYQDRVYWHSRE